MANPMPNEQELYEEIKKAGVSLDPRIWQILSHHIGNDIQVIYLSVRCLADLPPWVRKMHMIIMKFHRPFQRTVIARDIHAVCGEALNRVENINELMKKIRATVHSVEENQA
jgi:hypothetical protein